MSKHLPLFVAACCIGLIVAGSGCQPNPSSDSHGDDHGHSHDHSHSPKSLSAAVAELEEMWSQISTAMDKDDPKAAHEPLHEVGHLIKSIPDLAADTDLSEEEWIEIKEHSDKLFKAFGDIDSTFHKDGDKQAAYDAAKSIIDEGIKALEAKLPEHGEGSATSDHGHDHDDHGHDEHGHDAHDDEHEADDEYDDHDDHEEEHAEQE